MKLQELQQKSQLVRRDIVRMAYEGQTSHVGSALSCADIMTVLYGRIMNIRPDNWQDKDTDRFILSKGHGAKAWYAILAQQGFMDHKMLAHYGRDGSNLGEHPSADSMAGIMVTTGSLGHGMGIGAGMSLAKRAQGYKGCVYVLISDGECNEGSVWEAAMAISKLALTNLTVIIDDNGMQAMGPSRSISALEPFADKWKSFGWNVSVCDGHDLKALLHVFEEKQIQTKPHVIIAKTCLGKGIDFMENDVLWHYQIPSQLQYEQAMKQLEGQ